MSQNWRDAPDNAQFAVIGDPVLHSLSPAMHAAAFSRLGLSHRYVALQVPAGEVRQALTHLESLGYIGVNVTVPHKAEALSWCNSLNEVSQRAQSVNAIRLRDRSGVSTDGAGFVSAVPPKVKRALVLGSGGSARVVAVALDQIGVHVEVWARNENRAHEMGFPVASKPRAKDFDLVVNATSAGLSGVALSVDWTGSAATAYDLAYGNAAEAFLRAARDSGHSTIDGFRMLAEQGARSLEFWLEPLIVGQETRDLMLATAIRSYKVMGGPEAISNAASALNEGRLVVIPTETVYGLAANALDESAIRSVFRAKGRPASNPLIVHVRDVEQARSLVQSWPEVAQKLAGAFWPGPLTMVLPKAEIVPTLLTGGLETVAVRMPAHPVALALLESVNFPLAAPSANVFTALSPTQTDHLSIPILEAAAFILEGGPCDVGIESTVVDLVSARPSILREGIISRFQVEEVLGGPIEASNAPSARSPGQHPKHYSPRAKLTVVKRPSAQSSALVLGVPLNDRQIQMPHQEDDFARELYSALHRLDALGVSEIQVEAPPESWTAVWDRLRRASHSDTISE